MQVAKKDSQNQQLLQRQKDAKSIGKLLGAIIGANVIIYARLTDLDWQEEMLQDAYSKNPALHVYDYKLIQQIYYAKIKSLRGQERIEKQQKQKSQDPCRAQ